MYIYDLLELLVGVNVTGATLFRVDQLVIDAHFQVARDAWCGLRCLQGRQKVHSAVSRERERERTYEGELVRAELLLELILELVHLGLVPSSTARDE